MALKKAGPRTLDVGHPRPTAVVVAGSSVDDVTRVLSVGMSRRTMQKALDGRVVDPLGMALLHVGISRVHVLRNGGEL